MVNDSAGPLPLLRSSQLNLLLRLVLALPVLIRDGAGFIRLKEQNLAQAFVREDANGVRRGIGYGNGNKAFPFRFEWRDVYQDADAGVGGLPDAERQDVTRDPEVL